jgi:hypothetical protein
VGGKRPPGSRAAVGSHASAFLLNVYVGSVVQEREAVIRPASVSVDSEVNVRLTRQNDLCGQLESESDLGARSLIIKKLVAVGDTLVADDELLARLYNIIIKGRELMAWHNIQLGGHDHNSRGEAQSSLECLVESQEMLERCCKAIIISIQKNKL